MFQPRHRWMINHVTEAFGVSMTDTEKFLKKEENWPRLNDFLKGESIKVMYIYYQPAEILNDAGEVRGYGEENELLLTSGEDVRLTRPAIYFLRTVADDTPIDLSKNCDNTLLFGMISENPLRSLETLLSKFFRESLVTNQQWGKAGNERGTEFIQDMDKFTADMREALKDVVGGLELAQMDRKYDPEVNKIKMNDEQMLTHFQALMNQWCTQISKYLEEDKEDDTLDTNSDVGPKTEYEYWRRRLQRLTSVAEQLKSKDVKHVVSTITQIARSSTEEVAQTYNPVLRRWKQTDINVTEAVNEAKDNVKYLFTLEKFIEPLYTGTPATLIDTLPALMNSIKMIHTIARYYNTTERMTKLFVKITNQMIVICKKSILGMNSQDELWELPPCELIDKMESCIRLNAAYQEQYRLTKDKLLTMPKGKQFDFSEPQIFGKFDQFCRRLLKLIDLFLTIQQFTALAEHKLEGMETIIEDFKKIKTEFESKRHLLLDYTAVNFDRDFVEFNVKISELEGKLQIFINESFESVGSITNALNLLKKFQSILQRDGLKNDLDSKFHIIFMKYGQELEAVQALYEKYKGAPPIPRNLPPVAGNITWSRHLLKRIEEPMKRFETNKSVLSTKEAKKIVKTYNKVARTLVAFEYLWYKAWIQSIDSAKTGLQATLIIRHPDDNKLYVNFDHEILQLIREAKCLDRMGIEIPESAKIVLLQEEKFKSYYTDLTYELKEYEKKVSRIIPITAPLLKSHLADIDYKLRPGMVTLTWTSMNIDAYKHHVQQGLQKLDELITHINDIVENRIEKNLKIVTRTILVDLPNEKSFALDEFVDAQEKMTLEKVQTLMSKNIEIEDAVEDLLGLITTYPLDPHIEPVDQDAVNELRRYYTNYMYQAILNATRNSLNVFKKRVGNRLANQEGIFANTFIEPHPFFEVDIQLAVPTVQLSPSLSDIQRAINKASQAVLKCTSQLFIWGQKEIPEDQKVTFFSRITKDIEVVRVILGLTGSIQGLKNQVNECLKQFATYDWLWKEGKDVAYEKFIAKKPQLEDFETELKKFVLVEEDIDKIPTCFNIGALRLNTQNLKIQLKHECSEWRVKYSSHLHDEAKEKMDVLVEYMRATTNKLNREVEDLESLRFAIDTLKEVREKESGIDMEITPILDMYAVLERYLPQGVMSKEEMDLRSVLRANWRKLVELAGQINDKLNKLQVGFKKQLLLDIKVFTQDVIEFRKDYEANGPMVKGLAPMEAVIRLRKYKEEFEIRWRKYETYHGGEQLFNLHETQYPELEKTKNEISNLDKLYGLYMSVIKTINEEWRDILWVDVLASFPEMSRKVDFFVKECKRMPKSLREWDAYNELRSIIESFVTILPLLEALTHESIRPRHWAEVMKETETNFSLDPEEFRLKVLLDAGLDKHAEAIEEICEGAKKQMSIENKLAEIKDVWNQYEFEFGEWKGRSVNILRGVVPIIEELEEAQMQLQTLLAQKHCLPFREEVQAKLTQLSETSDTLERWLKVQTLWCSLESVFTGGDIAKQMPDAAKRFGKVDKDFVKLMAKAEETKKVVEACSNELLKTSLPVMYSELEECQKRLEGYLENKRSKFPRFYFVSNPALLQILSKGSDPQQIQPYYENIFDSIHKVKHNDEDPSLIRGIECHMGDDMEYITLRKQVKCQGNIEEWLLVLQEEQKMTMKDICARTAQQLTYIKDVKEISGDAGSPFNNQLRAFVDNCPAQFALLGIQLLWTSDCQEAFMQCKINKKAVPEANKKGACVLQALSSWCLQDLKTKMNRTKIETLITIQVHQKDVMNNLATLYRNKRIRDANDFEWLKQARFYWRYDLIDHMNTPGTCVISITDVDFQYQHEYLGVKERLVITPLTDRCYITLAQAMGMFYGGAPAGPAGTGKTETVKDLGRSLGIYVVVTNCTDQMRYTDCGKLFKGLCQSGLWGCFDEFNRINLPVLSVVAQQVLAINNAKKMKAKTLSFPGDPQIITLNPVCGYFITMNPGYAGRQELPENLKALFRGVTMMVPDKQIIIGVKLCSVGFSKFPLLAKKFYTLYILCEQQLSKQRHYDFGLRNILSVLRTAGSIKRNNIDKPEEDLLFQALRDMNLSKLIAQDVPLFISLLEDLFPSVDASKGAATNEDVKAAVKEVVEKRGLIYHPSWITKVIQLCDTTYVRHGIMLVGPAGGGKTTCSDVLREALTMSTGVPYKQARMNPKAITAEEMFGETDLASDEWITGVFAAMWAKYNTRANKFNTWLILDGPVDAIWIENLNTVLDDNKILTLANNDRIPMTDNVKIMFENETLVNASPATVSRAGIIYVSETDLDWVPIMQAWVLKRNENVQKIITDLFFKYVGVPELNKTPGHIFDWLFNETHPVIDNPRAGQIAGCLNLLGVLLDQCQLDTNDENNRTVQLTKLFIYCFVWTLGGLLEPEDRVKLDKYIRELTGDASLLPPLSDEFTVYEYFVDLKTLDWVQWKATEWIYPETETLKFSSLLVPTMDSVRSLYLIEELCLNKFPVLLIGGPGTAKTSTALMFNEELDKDQFIFKHMNFSFATTMGMFQSGIETDLEKRGGKNFGPPNGKRMCIFIDDMSQPEVNLWNDQPTLEIVRQLVQESGFCFLDKDKRGDFKVCEDLIYLAAMVHPSGGRNNIPNRLKRGFFIFNLILPSITSINDIYGQMLEGRFQAKDFSESCLEVVNKLTTATIKLWNAVKKKMLPTPAKFHYNFDMRELSRIFQGILLTPKSVIQTGGSVCAEKDDAFNLVHLWCHECDRTFSDKLTNDEDKSWYLKSRINHCREIFGDEMAERINATDMFYVPIMRDPIVDPETDEIVEEAPLFNERGGTLQHIRERMLTFLESYNQAFPATQMHLVLFEDAMYHLMRVTRVLNTPRGSSLLVGVGGSGKQSLTRLAAHMLRHTAFQISLTKTYGVSNLFEDLKLLYKMAGPERKNVTFIFTDSEIKKECFLEYINSLLLTGEISGLLAKDELMTFCSEIGQFATKEDPEFIPTTDNLKRYLINSVRDNLHLVICMSPMNAKFAERATKFPAIISGCNIDWFLPWPQQALISVSQGVISDFPIQCTDDVKNQLMIHMGNVHDMVVEACDEYFNKMRRKVYQTPKSYLSFLNDYKLMYTEKMNDLNTADTKVNLGLEKLNNGAKQVEVMKVELAEEQVKLEKATEETNKMLEALQVKSAEVKKEGDSVAQMASQCEADAERISKEKALCQADLDKAQPFVDRAIDAINSILPAHIIEIKKLLKPSDIIRLVFDGCCLLFMYPMDPVVASTLIVAKKETPFIAPSWGSSLTLMNNANFLKMLQAFGAGDDSPKDKINEETIELLEPYLDLENFTPATAKTASVAAEGLCTWVGAMKSYHEASKIVKPKLEALTVAKAELDQANKTLAQVRERHAALKAKLEELQKQLEEQLAAKKQIEDNALRMERTMERANQLLKALAGEKDRWENDAASFAQKKFLLVGDVAIACAFIAYCGPFNQSFRSYLLNSKFIRDCQQRKVPVSSNIDISDFLADIPTLGSWAMQGLPSDPLSIQNGILVTRSRRFPLLIDPQGQAIAWLKKKEAENLPPRQETMALDDSKFKDHLEFCMEEGKSLIVNGVLEELDPVLDPLLEKQIIKKGRSLYIKIADKPCEVDLDHFRLYFITRLPNPHFTPELQAKITLIDFTVTQKGLEEQLLGHVIGREQRALEEQLNQVLSEVTENTQTLMRLDDELLTRLSSNEGNLLEDEELMVVLANTKAKASEVQEKLTTADVTKKSINEKREQYRPVATRGSCLYFSIVDMSNCNVMYQTSLAQFLEVFMLSMEKAEKAVLPAKRVGNIIDKMTYMVYRYINRGLYEADKLPFLFIMTTKILLTADLLKTTDIPLFLRGGAALDIGAVKQKPFKWMNMEAWLNVIQLSMTHPFFKTLPDDLVRNEAQWKQWYEANDPENSNPPEYGERFDDNKDIGPFLRMLLVRSLRVDRTMLAMKDFIRNTKQMGQAYVEPVTDTVESIYAEMDCHKPVIFLLSAGADPTDAIEALARKSKRFIQCVSMGDGQGPVAMKALKSASGMDKQPEGGKEKKEEVTNVAGSWVLLQNCELGLDVMCKLEDLLYDWKDEMHPDFRLFITALPDKDFPLGLLQMSIKVTNEPPAGLKAGLLRSYTVIVDQERLDVLPQKSWRQLLFSFCFLHSIVQERRKFGALGWNIPYEYNNGDLIASITFLEKHLLESEMSWDTTQYMVSEVQYGGKITDDLDRRLFNTYAKKWIQPSILSGSFCFRPDSAAKEVAYAYPILEDAEVEEIRKKISADFPDIDNPEVFGLHPNADLTFRVKEANAALDTLSNTQPKESSNSGKGRSREDVVVEKLDELLEKLPPEYVEEKYIAAINKIGGLAEPLNVFLYQELQRMEKVITFVRKACINIKQAINGEVVMTADIQDSMYAIFDARVPHNWVYKVTGDEFSWICATLGIWFSSLLDRHEQYNTWLEKGRPVSFWVTGFFNPQGFLTSMKQEVTRAHREDKWALDDVIYTTEVTGHVSKDSIKARPAEGVYVYGLFLEGCGWSTADKSLCESQPKVLFTPMPILLISAATKGYTKASKDKQNYKTYQCPLYKYPKRTGLFFISLINLPSIEKDGAHWTLRGVALLCTTE